MLCSLSGLFYEGLPTARSAAGTYASKPQLLVPALAKLDCSDYDPNAASVVSLERSGRYLEQAQAQAPAAWSNSSKGAERFCARNCVQQ